MVHSVDSYLAILLAYKAGKKILMRDKNYFGGWRPKGDGTAWLFGIAEYKVQESEHDETQEIRS